MNNLKNKVCIVTGSTSGIGLVTAKELAKMGTTTILVARNKERGKVALKEVIEYSKNEKTDLLICDFSSQSSIVAFTETFKKKYNRLDVLINNAGLISNKRMETDLGIELTFAVNHLGYFITTNLLLDMLQDTPSSRIIVVASDLHFNGRIDFDNLMCKNNYNGFNAYSNSKLANILFTYKLNDILKSSETTINAIHPGVVKTKFGIEDRNSNLIFPAGRISPEESAKALIYLTTSLDIQDVSGKYFNKMNMEQSSTMSYNKELADVLWQKSIEYCSML
jgi:NAD(P)-dependent dehydrogenase (short-subunit alcohol dehydrogenase family)